MYPTQPQNMTRKNLDFYLHLNVTQHRYNAAQTFNLLNGFFLSLTSNFNCIMYDMFRGAVPILN